MVVWTQDFCLNVDTDADFGVEVELTCARFHANLETRTRNMLAASGLNEERYIVKVLWLGKMCFWKSKLKINMPGKKLPRLVEMEDSEAATFEDILELLFL